MSASDKAFFHLPGLFEFYEFYKVFLALFREHREYFYEGFEIGSIYGAPADCLWGGGRVGFGEADPRDVKALMTDYSVSARLTFSNSLLRPEHLGDRRCNELAALFENGDEVQNGLIVASDLLVAYLRERYPNYYLVSSTTKVLSRADFIKELARDDFRYVVPDFRLNKDFELWSELGPDEKGKVEFLCNECCSFDCPARKECYENVSLKSLGEDVKDHICVSPQGDRGYRFSEAMKNPAFIGLGDIKKTYIPMGFRHFKIEGRSLGSAILLEFLLYYMTKPEYHLKVREEIYLDSMLDLF